MTFIVSTKIQVKAVVFGKMFKIKLEKLTRIYSLRLFLFQRYQSDDFYNKQNIFLYLSYFLLTLIESY